MGKSRRQKSGSQWSSECEREEKKNLTVDNAADNTIKKSDLEFNLFCDERAVGSSNTVSENVDGSSSRSEKTSRFTGGSRKVKRLCSAKRVLKPWPSRNLESVVCDCKLIYVCKLSKACRKIRNERRKSHRCFDFTLQGSIQACCLASKRGSWNLVNRQNQNKRLKSASLQTKDLWKLSSSTSSSSSDVCEQLYSVLKPLSLFNNSFL